MPKLTGIQNHAVAPLRSSSQPVTKPLSEPSSQAFSTGLSFPHTAPVNLASSEQLHQIQGALDTLPSESLRENALRLPQTQLGEKIKSQTDEIELGVRHALPLGPHAPKTDTEINSRHEPGLHRQMVSDKLNHFLNLRQHNVPNKEAAYQKHFLRQVVASPPFNSLPSSEQAQLKTFLSAFPTAELMDEEIQGESTREVNNSHNGGHQVHSIMGSLRSLHANGLLTSGLLDQLNTLQATPDLTPAWKNQRESLIRSTLQNIAHPENIAQHKRESCTATVAETLMVLKQPETYVEMVTELAKGNSFRGISPYLGIDANDSSGRSVASRLVQTSFMQFEAQSDNQTYDNATDKRSDNKTGATAKMLQPLLNTLLPETGGYQIERKSKSGTGPADFMAQLKTALSDRQKPIPVGCSMGGYGHEMLLMGIDKTHAHVINPWGILQKIPNATFQESVLNACIPENKAPQLKHSFAIDRANYHELSPELFKTLATKIEEKGIASDRVPFILETLNTHGLKGGKAQSQAIQHLAQLEQRNLTDEVLKTVQTGLGHLPLASSVEKNAFFQEALGVFGRVQNIPDDTLRAQVHTTVSQMYQRTYMQPGFINMAEARNMAIVLSNTPPEQIQSTLQKYSAKYTDILSMYA